MNQRLSQAQKREIAQSCIHAHLKQAVRLVTQQFDAALSAMDIRATQYNLLVASSLMGTVPLTVLADELGLDRTTLSRNLKPLETRHLIHTYLSDQDSRVRLVEITTEGERLILDAYPLWKSIQKEVTKVFDDETYKSLLNQLEQLQS
ncbi:MAG: MarR family winged helix-turn-helix transcriptional regulator [Deinococcota bacterium]